MIITAFLIFLLAISAFRTKHSNGDSLREFDRPTTEPLRGLLALLIVGHHLGQRTSIPFISGFMGSIGMPVVAIFFFLSGYGLYVSYNKKGNDYLNGFLRKRFGKILPLFIVLTVIGLVARACLGDSVLSQLVEFVDKGQTPLPFSWFMYAVIYLYIAFLLSALVGRTQLKTGVLFFAMNLLYFNVIYNLLHWPFFWTATILSANAGYFVGYCEKYISSTLRTRPMLTYGMTILALSAAYVVCEKVPALLNTSAESWTCVWLIMIALSIYAIIRGLGIASWRPLCWCAAISLEIYLVHGLVVHCLCVAGVNEYELVFVGITYLLSISGAWAASRVPGIIRRPSRETA